LAAASYRKSAISPQELCWPKMLVIGSDHGGNRENDVGMAVRQKIGLAFGQPGADGLALTFETMQVAATVIGDSADGRTPRSPRHGRPAPRCGAPRGRAKNDNFAILAPSQCGYFFPWEAGQPLIWEMLVEFIDDSLVEYFRNFAYV